MKKRRRRAEGGEERVQERSTERQVGFMRRRRRSTFVHIIGDSQDREGSLHAPSYTFYMYAGRARVYIHT